MASLVMHKKDTFPPLKALLEQENQETKKMEKIDLKNAVKVTAIVKPTEGSVKTFVCTAQNAEEIKKATGANSGRVEAYWLQASLEPTKTPETYHVEFEIEWAESAGVKRYQTVSNEGYYTIEVLTEGGAVGAGLTVKRFDTFPPLKATLTMPVQEFGKSGAEAPINFKEGGPGKTAVESVKAILKTAKGVVIFEEVCTGEAGAGIKTVTNGVAEYAWHQNDLKTATPAGEPNQLTFLLEWKESEEGHTGTKVKQFFTVPTLGYFPITVVEDLENV